MVCAIPNLVAREVSDDEHEGEEKHEMNFILYTLMYFKRYF